MSTASSQLRIGMLSPGQSWTRLHAGLEVDAERGARWQGLEQRRLADARRPKDGDRRLAVRLGQPLVGGDDVQSHRCPHVLVVLQLPSRSGKPGPDAVHGAKRSRLSPRIGCCMTAKTRLEICQRRQLRLVASAGLLTEADRDVSGWLSRDKRRAPPPVRGAADGRAPRSRKTGEAHTCRSPR